MKHKFLTVLLALVAAFCLCFGLAACGETPKAPAGTTPNGQESTENNQDDDGEGGNKETEEDEDTNPDEGGEQEPDGGGEGTGGDETPDEGGEGSGGEQEPSEGGGQGGDEEPDEGNPDEGGEGTGGDEEPDEGNPDEGGEQGGSEEEGGGHETSHTHNFTGYEYNNDATCERDGTETGHCTCGENDTRTKTGTALGHDMTFYAGTATCISAGTIDYWRCSRCKRNFADDTGDTELYTIESEPLSHQFTAENKCKWYDTCGAEWEYTEGLRYSYNTTTNTYAVGTNTNISISGDIVIPYGYNGKFVTRIYQYAFDYCTGITSITIPGSIQTIEPGALVMKNNTLEHIIVTEDNPNYKSEQECLIEIATGTLILGCKNSVIPSDITAIGDGAFCNCDGMTDITIPDSVTSIGYAAFNNSAYFNDPTHWDADGVLYIDNHLIQAKTTLSGDYTVRAGTKTIAAWAFSSKYYDSGGKVCSDLTSIAIPDSVVTIGMGAFEACRGLKTITIGRGVTAIGVRAFSFCNGLESITVDVNNSSYSCQGGILYNKEQTEIVHVPKAIKGAVTIPNGVTKIKNWAFNGCNGLTDIIIPSSVTEIGDNAFSNCDGLTDITIPAGAIIAWEAFEKCSRLNSITFKGTVAIGSFAFEDCTNLTAVYISDLTAWCNSYFSLATPDLSNPLALAHHLYLDGQEVSDLTIPNGITEIKGGAFYGCTGLKRITIPDSVISIGVSAFEGTAYYNDPSHWDEDGVLYIGNHLIMAQPNLAGEYIVRAGTKTIAENAFAQCETLTEVTIPNSVVSIGSATFSRCVNLTKITIPNTVTVIGYEAFYCCGELIDIQFMGTVKEWQEICKGEYPYDTDMNWSLDSGTGDYTITCTDGTIDKEGNVVMN